MEVDSILSMLSLSCCLLFITFPTPTVTHGISASCQGVEKWMMAENRDYIPHLQHCSQRGGMLHPRQSQAGTDIL